MPSFAATGKIVARALGLTPEALIAAFVPARAEHLAAVVALRRRVLDSAVDWDDAAYLSWRYHFGSAARGRGDCWVLLLGQRVIALVGTENVEVQGDAGVVPAVMTMDIAVDPQFADCGLGVWMNLSLFRRTPLALEIGCNEQSRNLVTRLFRLLPDRRSYVHPIDFRRYLSKHLRPRWLSRPLAALAGGLMAGWRALALRGVPALELRDIPRFDAPFQSLLDRARLPGEVCLRRSIDFLNWRLFANPRMQYTVWGAYQSGLPVGYLAVANKLQNGAIDAVDMVDWQIDPQCHLPVFRRLCRQALDYAVKSAAEVVTVTAYHHRSERALRAFGFMHRSAEFQTIGLAGTDTALVERLSAHQDWFVTEANTDRDGL